MAEEVEAHDGIAAMARGDTLVTLWRAPARLDRWKWQHDKIAKLAAAKPSVILVSLILASSDPPDGPMRARMQKDFRDLGDKLRQIVVVPLGSSMWMSVVRTIVRATLLLSGQAGRQSVAANLDDGLRRVAEFAGTETPTGPELRKMFAAMSTALGTHLEGGADERA